MAFVLGGLLVLGLAGFAAGVLATDLFPNGSDESLVITLVGLDTMLAALASLMAVSGWYRVATGWPRLVLTLALAAAWVIWAVIVLLVNDLLGSETDGAIRAAAAALKQGQEAQLWFTIGTAVGANILMASHPNRD